MLVDLGTFTDMVSTSIGAVVDQFCVPDCGSVAEFFNSYVNVVDTRQRRGNLPGWTEGLFKLLLKTIIDDKTLAQEVFS